MFSQIKANGSKINKEKFIFSVDQILFSGQTLTNHDISPDKKKTEAIDNMVGISFGGGWGLKKIIRWGGHPPPTMGNPAVINLLPASQLSQNFYKDLQKRIRNSYGEKNKRKLFRH